MPFAQRSIMHRAVSRYNETIDEETALVQQHAGLIHRCARFLCTRTGMWDAYDDFWSAGALGLLDAWRRFDVNKAVRFESFAEHRVRGAMIDELRRMDHLPRRLRAKAEQVQRTHNRLQQQLGREPTRAEVAQTLRLDIEETDALYGLLDKPLLVNAELEVPQLTQEHASLDRLDREDVKVAIAHLPERLQIVLSLRYVEGLTYREIGSILDVSEPRVCQLHNDAVGKIRAYLRK